MLYKVNLLDGQFAYVYMLFEHKSYPEPLVALQVLRYMVKIWEQSLKLEFLTTALRYLVTASDTISSEDLQEAVEAIFPDGGDIVTTIAKTWIEQGQQQGIRQGLLNGIELGLELRFGKEGLQALPEIHKIEDVDLLQAILTGLKTASTLDELRQIYRQPA